MGMDSMGPCPAPGILVYASWSGDDQIDLAVSSPTRAGVRGVELVSASGATATLMVKYASNWVTQLPGDTKDAEGYSSLTLAVGQSIGLLQIIAVRKTGSTSGATWRLFP